MTVNAAIMDAIAEMRAQKNYRKQMQLIPQTFEDKLEIANARIEVMEAEIKRMRQRDKMARDFINTIGMADSFTQDDQKNQETLAHWKRLVKKGEHMEIFEAANAADPMVNDAWSRYMMCLRLVGFDGTREESNDGTEY